LSVVLDSWFWPNSEHPDWGAQQVTTGLLSANGPCPVTKADIEEHFSHHGTGTIKEVKLMNGFGFIEYEDAMDAKDVVPGMFVPTIISTR
jgi:hypothetical protein